MARALLILNEDSRKGAELSDRVRAALREHGLEVEDFSFADAVSDDTAFAERAAAADRIIVGGGDGTLNGIADRLVEVARPTGILPIGTANDLARSLGIPEDPGQACAIAAGDVVRAIDIGRVNDKCFFNVASFGLSVEITERLTKERKRVWGVFAYALAALDAARRTRPFSVEIVVDGDRHRAKVIQVAVGNGRFYGGGMTVHRNTRIDDGWLDLYGLKPVRPWRLPAVALRLRTGMLDDADYAFHLRGRRFELTPPRRRTVNADGEIVTTAPCTVEILPQALDVFVPSQPGPAFTEAADA